MPTTEPVVAICVCNFIQTCFCYCCV